MNRKLFIVAFVLALFLATVSWAAPSTTVEATADLLTKQLAAPPTEFAARALPNAAETGLSSHTALIPVELTQGKDGLWRWQGEVAVDDGRQVTLMVLSAATDQWQLSLSKAGTQLQLAPAQALPAGITYQRSQFSLGEAQGYPADVYLWEKAASGAWQVTVTAAKPNFLNANGADGYLVIGQETPYQLYSHLNHYELLLGREIGLTAYLYDTRPTARGAGRTPLRNTITQATMVLQTPTGQSLTIPMQQNGNGEFVALATPTAVGNYVAQIKVQGVTPTGQPFIRTSEHVFPVIAPAVQLLNNTIVGQAVDDTRVALNLNVATTNDQAANFTLSAELWGTNAQNQMVPVVWLGGTAALQTDANGQTYLPLSLDSRWVSLAQAQEPFELRQVRVQDGQTHIPVAQAAQLAIAMPKLATHDLNSLQTIPEDMLMGARPDAALVTNPSAVNSGRLLLVHGYCSGGVWPAAQFTNASTFLDANQSRTHDQFANLIRNYGAQFSSFGIVAHSQGGAAALHLYTYYWSGLDYSSGSRLIQSVGTPYQGTALAGSLAMIGSVFGAGCGTNWDLTYDGASLWLSGIPTWARSRVYYSTTSFNDVWWRYDYCHLATDVFLSDPEDGTTEKSAGQLSGANNMGHKTGWCHTAGMRDPAQYTDSSRNANMNTYANR